MKLSLLRDSIAHEWGFGNDYALRRRIEVALVSARATVVQRRFDATKQFPQQLISTVKCIEVIKAKDCVCDCPGKIMVRTKQKVPKPLILKENILFNQVYTNAVKIPFSYVPFHEIHNIKNRKFSANCNYYSYSDEYVYIINSNSLKEINLRYIPEDIIALSKLGECSGSCFEDGEVVIEGSLEDAIRSLVEKQRPTVITGKEDSEIEING